MRKFRVFCKVKQLKSLKNCFVLQSVKNDCANCFKFKPLYSTHELYTINPRHAKTALLLYNIGKLKHCSIDEKDYNQGIPPRAGNFPAFIYPANFVCKTVRHWLWVTLYFSVYPSKKKRGRDGIRSEVGVFHTLSRQIFFHSRQANTMSGDNSSSDYSSSSRSDWFLEQ